MTAQTKTVVDKIESTLAKRILRREYPDRLPSVRALASEFDTTAPTIQRVVARLEAHGLVEARQGSGIRVLDVKHHGTLGLLPVWFEVLRDQPDEATRVFSECMELRRMMAAQLFRRIPEPTVAIAEALHAVYSAETFEARRDADLAFTRAIIDSADHFGASALFNTVEKVIREVPGVAESFYCNPELLRETLDATMAVVGLPGEEAEQRLVEVLKRWDDHAMERFREYLAK